MLFSTPVDELIKLYHENSSFRNEVMERSFASLQLSSMFPDLSRLITAGDSKQVLRYAAAGLDDR